MKNKIQYISLCHNSKEMAQHHKKTCNGLHTVYMADLSFDEIADLLENGNTIGRIGNKTSFIAIDVDNSTVNISKVIETYKNDANYRVSYSSSNNPLKYHILVNLNREITKDDYKTVLEEEFNKIANEVKGRCDIFELDTHAANFYQCFYGQSVETISENIIEGSTRLYCWTKKENEPKVYIDEYTVKQHPTMNSAEYCKKHNLLTVQEEKRFDIILPSMTNGRLKKIAEGHRWDWCRMTGTKIMMRIFHLKHSFNEGWTKWDFLDTAEWAFRSNIINSNSFEADMKTLLLWLDNKWDILVNKSFDEQCAILEPYFDCSKKQYKSRAYNSTVMSQLILEHQYDNNTIVFADKDELQQLCKELMIDFYKFIKFAKSVHFEVQYECVTDKRTKYDCTGMTKDEFDAYCKDNKISKVQKSRLKKKYDIKG